MTVLVITLLLLEGTPVSLSFLVSLPLPLPLLDRHIATLRLACPVRHSSSSVFRIPRPLSHIHNSHVLIWQFPVKVKLNVFLLHDFTAVPAMRLNTPWWACYFCVTRPKQTWVHWRMWSFIRDQRWHARLNRAMWSWWRGSWGVHELVNNSDFRVTSCLSSSSVYHLRLTRSTIGCCV